MALTFTGPASGSYMPANNRMLFTMSSTNSAQPNFRYFADIYVNGSPDFNRVESVVNPTYSSGVVDVAGVIQSFLTGNPEDNTTTFKKTGNHICSYTIQFGEKYGPSSGITEYPNITSRQAYAYNGYFETIEFSAYNDNEWTMIDGDSRFLTDCPRLETTTTDKLCIGFMVKAADDAKYIEISTFEADGSFQDTVRILNPYNSLSDTASRSIDIDVSYAWLNSLVTADFVSGTAPFIASNTAYYTVKMLDSAFADASENIRVYIVDRCSKYTPVRFKFMNNYGKYDYFTFTGATKKNTDIKRNSFKSDDYSWSSSGYSNYSGNLFKRGRTQHETVLTDAITISSDWITEAQNGWLEQLVSSPDAYIYDASGNLVPIDIIAGNYEHKYEASDQLFNITVTYRIAYNRIRQRR